MIAILLMALAVCFFIVVQGFFSGCEVAFLSVNRPKLFRRAKEKDVRAVSVKQMLSSPETLFATSVIGTTVSIACSTSIVTYFVSAELGPNWEWLPLAILTPFVLIFGEFIPKLIGRNYADTAVLRLSHSFRVASFIFYPISRALDAYASGLRRVLGETREKGFFLSREEIKAALPASQGSDVTPAERSMITRILEARRVTVKEMQRPLIDVIAIEESESLEAALKLFGESGHSRMPVYRERVDNIVGVIHGYDCLLLTDFKRPLSSAMRPPYFVPESKPLDELLDEVRGSHIAIVVNEYGGAEGIVTLEDVMEEIVGEIEDEYDEPPKLYRQIGDNSFVVNARMEVDDLRETLGISIPRDDEYQTLAGFLLKHMQKIPKKWDSTILNNVEYVIQSSTDRSIEEVYIIRHKAD